MSAAPRVLLILVVATSACLFEDPGPGAAYADTELVTSAPVSTTGEPTPTTGGPEPMTGGPMEPCGWDQVIPAESPPPRIDATLTHDEERRWLLLFGGKAGLVGPDMSDTWAFDGAKWTRILDGGRPSERRGHAAAWDRERKRVVLFGGESGGFDTQFATGTWTHDGKEWEEIDLDAGDGPSLRANAAMADLPMRKRVVLFGGRTQGGPSAETWTWDGSDWTQVTPPSSPSPRFDHTLALDEPSKRLVLHGGCGTNLCNAPLTDTWAFDGEQWTQLDGGAGPGPRAGGMAYDRSEPALLRFGDGDAWRWMAMSWMPAGSAPQANAGFAVAYHTQSAGVVLFGGFDAMLMHTDETWVFRCGK